MSDRATLSRAFLAGTDWETADRAFLAGDASARSYDRLRLPDGRTAVLMDAPPGQGEDVADFTRVGRHLLSLGLSAPRILAEDAARGFLLLEDLGDALFARRTAEDPACERPLYLSATEVLVRLQAAPPLAGLPVYDAAAMAEAIAPATEWYRRALTGDRDGAEALRTPMQDLLAAHAGDAPVMILRDYHAENLLWLPERQGVARVGLLDFQMAMLSHPAVDLVSLCQDARRDCAPGTEAAAIHAFVEATGRSEAGFRTAYALIGAQRHLRILGVFARLCLHYAKPRYVDFLPRVWRDLQRDLAEPALAPLARAVTALLPPPDPEALKRMSAQCGTVPTA